MERLTSAKFDEAKLRTLARDGKTPKVQAEARRRLDVIATEQNSYEAVKSDIAGLREFVAQPCEACLSQEDARRQLQILLAAREEQDEVERLTTTKFDEARLRTLARDAKTPKVQAEARRRLDVIATEQNSYVAVKNDITSLREFVATPCEACLVQGDARRQLQILNEEAAAIESRLVSQLVGYAMFAVIGADNEICKKYFVITDKPDSLFPAPNDIVTANRTPDFRAMPYHWDISIGKIVYGSPKLPDLKNGQQAKVGGDVFISIDPNNGEQYAIAPISDLIGTKLPKIESPFTPQLTSRKILGYVYIGQIDNKTNKYNFINQTRQDAIYPAVMTLWLQRQMFGFMLALGIGTLPIRST